MFDRIWFVIGEAIIAFRRNGFMTLAAISTIAISLFMLGGMVYILYQAQGYVETIPGKFDIRLMLKDGTKYETIAATAKQIRAIPGVKDATWVPRDKVWQKKKAEMPDVLSGIDNPYPDAIKVTLSDLDKTDSVVAALKKLPATNPEDGVQYLKDVHRFIDQLLNLLRWFGGVLGGTLFVTSGILIYIAIRSTIVSRRREIRIMQLVGASHWTIKIPFLIEGLVQGVSGGTIAALLLDGAHRVLEARLEHETVLQVPHFPLGMAVLVLGLVGGTYGILCSLISASAPLKTS